MKTAEEVLNEYVQYTCKLHTERFDYVVTVSDALEAMREYARQAVEEQLKVSADETGKAFYDVVDSDYMWDTVLETTRIELP